MKFLDKHFGRSGNRMFQMAYLYARMREGSIPDYYLQDPKYFDNYADEIKQLFGEGIGKDEHVSIHVRRGKNPSVPEEPAYADNPFYVDLTKTDYYKNAINLFGLNTKFLIFSDDINFCKEYFTGYGFDFSEGKTEEEDFRAMASCTGHIIANSSFSWWAAYLGKGKVIYPKNWYSDGVERTVCPKEWIKI